MAATLKKPWMNEGETEKHGFPTAFWFVRRRLALLANDLYLAGQKEHRAFRNSFHKL
jgi:hypothetical protein